MEMGCERDNMSVSAAGGEATIEPDQCRSAEQYVLEALEASTAARSPKELAQGYGCSVDHVRNVVSDLAQEGRIKRVETGLYTSLDSSEPALPSEPETEHNRSDGSEGGDTDGSADGSGADSDTEVTDRPSIEDDERADVVDVEEREEGGIGAGTALVGATLGLAAIVLVTGRSGSSSASSASAPSPETDETDETDQTDETGADGLAYTDWGAE